MTSLADVRGGASLEARGGRAEEKAERDLPLRAAERHRRSLCFSRDPRIVAGSILVCCGWCTLLLLFVVLLSLLAHFQSTNLQQTLRMTASDSKLVTEADTRLCPRLRLDNPSQGLASMLVLSQAPEQLDRYSFSFNEPSRLSPQSLSTVYFAHLSPRANVTFNACKDDEFEDADLGANAVRARLRLYAFNSYASYQDWLIHGQSSYVDSIEVVNLCSAGQPTTYRHSATSDNDWYYVFRLDDVSLTIVFKPGMSLERINYGVVADHLLDECMTSGLLGTPNCTVRTVRGAHYLIRTEVGFDLALATEMRATCTGVDEAYLPATVGSTIAISLIALVAFFGGIGLCICYCCKESLSNCLSSGCTLTNCCQSSQLVSTTRRHDHGDYYDAQHLISQEHYGDTEFEQQGPSAPELTSEV